MFSEKWLALPDDAPVPSPGTPGVVFPENGTYLKFETNFARFAAQELTKRLDPSKFERKGFILQVRVHLQFVSLLKEKLLMKNRQSPQDGITCPPKD